MPSFNKVILMGHLTRDPELKVINQDLPLVEFGLAVNHTRKNKAGEKIESVCFIDCVLFGARAEAFAKYLSKGRPVLIEGRLQLDTWTTKTGEKRSKHKVSVENFTFVDSRQDQPPAAQPASTGTAAPPPPEPTAPAYQPPAPGDESSIPF